jgi:hypothetical protein
VRSGITKEAFRTKSHWIAYFEATYLIGLPRNRLLGDYTIFWTPATQALSEDFQNESYWVVVMHLGGRPAAGSVGSGITDVRGFSNEASLGCEF